MVSYVQNIYNVHIQGVSDLNVQTLSVYSAALNKKRTLTNIGRLKLLKLKKLSKALNDLCL